MTVLLHACCGPCASACVPALKGAVGDVSLLFANSNIDTREEFEKRLREAEKLASVEGVPIAALPYDHEEWLREVAAGFEHEPEKGERCARCFRYNLRKAAEYAKAHGFDAFTTSLTVSPHKVSAMVFAAACDAEEAVTGVRNNPWDSSAKPHFAACDFKAHGGYDYSVKRAMELGLYRQSYCGCEFSKLRWKSTTSAKRSRRTSTRAQAVRATSSPQTSRRRGADASTTSGNLQRARTSS